MPREILVLLTEVWRFMPSLAVIIVTHNSQPFLSRCLAALAQQSQPPQHIALVDSGSNDPSSLQAYQNQAGFFVSFQANIGFSRANNLAWQAVAQAVDYVLFLNPDAFPQADSLEKAVNFLQQSPQTAALGGRLLGFDIEQGAASGCVDSSGIFRTWYGRWYDRDQGQPDSGQHDQVESVPALCGAFFFARNSVLHQVALGPGRVFDSDFFLYKEDIELSLRIRKQGWKLMYVPDIHVQHCRGWQASRRQVPFRQKLLAARSELLLYRKHPSPYMLWAWGKYFAVRGLGL